MKSDKTYVQIFKCHFYLNLTFDTKNYLAKYFLFLISRPAQEQSCLSPMLQTRFLFFFSPIFHMCTVSKNILKKAYQFLWCTQKLSWSCDEYVPRYKLLNLTKSKGGCTKNVIVQWGVLACQIGSQMLSLLVVLCDTGTEVKSLSLQSQPFPSTDCPEF